MLIGHASSCVEGRDDISDAIDIVDHAHRHTMHGGSVAVYIAIMRPEGHLEVANIGDYGICVFRGRKCTFATNVQH